MGKGSSSTKTTTCLCYEGSNNTTITFIAKTQTIKSIVCVANHVSEIQQKIPFNGGTLPNLQEM